MAEAVTTCVPTTVNTTDATYNMEHVFSASLDGWGHFAIQVRVFNTRKNKSAQYRYFDLMMRQSVTSGIKGKLPAIR